MLEDTININKLCWNPAVLKKKLVKPLKNCFFGPNFHRKGVIMHHAQDEKKTFFGRNNKSRSSAFRKFLFYQNIICFHWVMNLFLSWVMLSVKKVSFPAKTAVRCVNIIFYFHKKSQKYKYIIAPHLSSTSTFTRIVQCCTDFIECNVEHQKWSI